MRRFAALLIPFVAVSLAGCHTPAPPVASAPFYPIGLYGVNDTNDFAAVRAAGFNVITGPAQAEFLEAARANGLKVLARPDTEAGPQFDPAKAGRAIRHFDAHPALWAWYLVDEPDYNAISPEAVRRAQAGVKAFHPAKPTALVLAGGHSARDYAGLADITMIDRYPIPWLPLANFGQHVGLVRAALPPGRPLMAVLQAFDWSTDRGSLPDVKDAPLRPPTYAELRCMTYEALARGADGLFYFAFDTGAWQLRRQPETWAALQRVVAEVNARLPLFRATPVWWPRRLQFADPEQGFNAALESSVTLGLLRVSAGDPAWPAGDYLLAVNNTPVPQRCGFALPPGNAGRVTVAGEHRELPVAGGWVTDAFEPFGVHVYGPLP
jgi:hypothetical protein